MLLPYLVKVTPYEVNEFSFRIVKGCEILLLAGFCGVPTVQVTGKELPGVTEFGSVPWKVMFPAGTQLSPVTFLAIKEFPLTLTLFLYRDLK